MTQLILKRAPIGDNLEDYNVLENGVVVGRILPVARRAEGSPLARIMHHAACFYTSIEQMRASAPFGWIGVGPLAVQRVWY
jgi:hypothetical protein